MGNGAHPKGHEANEKARPDTKASDQAENKDSKKDQSETK